MEKRLGHQLELLAARALTALPAPVQWRLSGAGPLRLDGQLLSPELQILLAARRRMGAPGMTDLHPHVGRARLRRDALVFAGRPLAVARVRDLELQLGDRALLARHYATGTAGAPLLVFFHGGGFVLGDLDSHDAPCRWLCRHAGVDVLSVDYRLAPEHPFPAAAEDAIESFRWARANAAALGADPARVAVGGDSAGANLSAVVAQACRGEQAPIAQLLLYPAVDRSTVRPSLELFADGFLLTRKDVEWFTAQYLSGAQHVNDPRVAPLHCPDLSGLAPALVVTAGFDPLRDEGEAYAEALRAAGSHAVTRRFDRLIHGFVNLVGVSAECRRAVHDIARTFRRLVHG